MEERMENCLFISGNILFKFKIKSKCNIAQKWFKLYAPILESFI